MLHKNAFVCIFDYRAAHCDTFHKSTCLCCWSLFILSLSLSLAPALALGRPQVAFRAYILNLTFEISNAFDDLLMFGYVMLCHIYLSIVVTNK